MDKLTGKFISASVIGANHADKGITCQDAAMTAALYHKGYQFYFMAVADGHGGAAYTRSDVGSFLAMQAASEAVNRFIMFVIDVFEKYPANWVEAVKKDFTERFGKMLVSNWGRMVEAHANDTEEKKDDVVKLYGTTVALALVFNSHLFTGRIGDSSVFAMVNQNKKLHVHNFFETDGEENQSLGLGTASLCSRDAYRKWQVGAAPLNDIHMLLLATDGFADSLKEPMDEVQEYYRYISKKGIANFEQIISKELIHLTNKGVGDDISMVIFLPDKNNKVW